MGKGIFYSPILPVDPEEVELKGKHLDCLCVIVDPVGVGLEISQSLGISVLLVDSPHLMQSDVSHFQI